MKNDHYRRFFFRWLPFIIFSLPLLISPAFAAGEAGGWRSIYDEIMRWLNFSIFVLVIIKFARVPLVDFLKGRKEEVADEIKQVETQKQRAEEDVQGIVQQFEESSRHLEKIKTRILNQGERRKQQIITDARSESEMMLNASKINIKGQIANARDRLRFEIIDEAIDMALKKLPDEITDQDNAKIVNDYFQQAMPD